jgi:hypothetical protein
VIVPAEEDLATLALERDAAWEAVRISADIAENERRRVTSYRLEAARKQPLIDSFNLISRVVTEWQYHKAPRPPEHVLQEVQSIVAEGRKRANEIQKIQKEAK